MASPIQRVFVSAGEPSGDRYAAAMVRELLSLRPDLEIEALGGSRLRETGTRVRFGMEPYTAMGFAEILRGVPAHWKLLRRLTRELRAGRFALVILVDYPGFNVRLARAARSAGVRVLYYIPPKLWASGPKRTAAFAKVADRVAVTLPFEPAFFAGHGVRVDHVGHPLSDRPPLPPRDEARRRLGLSPSDRVLALFPGSRRQEVGRLWPPFRAAARRLLAEGACTSVVVAAMRGLDYPDSGGFVRSEDVDAVLAGADAALVKAGTATLEGALADLPMVVAYRVHPATAWVVRRILTVRWVSLVNLIADRQVVPELLQEAATPDRLAREARLLLDPAGDRARAERSGFAEVRSRLGGPGASRRVAVIAAELLS